MENCFFLFISFPSSPSMGRVSGALFNTKISTKMKIGDLVLIVKSVYVCFSSDSTDSVGGRGGVLPLLAPSSHHPSVGGVWLIPFEPSIFYIPRHCTLPGLQQLLCQPNHLRVPL